MTTDLTVGQKLRAILIAAQQKMHKNRFKDLKVTGKWPEGDHDSAGGRTWDKADPANLQRKFREEVAEFETELVHIHWSAPSILKEAGDVLNMTMMLTDRYKVYGWVSPHPPKVICLCGSTKFRDQFQDANFRLTMEGHIVLSVGFFMHSEPDRHVPTGAEKDGLDELHKRKIDLADEIFVVNVGGYIGSSTMSEIHYATTNGKPITYLEPLYAVHVAPYYKPGACEHDFTADEQGFTASDSICTKCGMSFVRYVHTECP